MARDEHLGTGEYDPETYWNARARWSRGDRFRAVCGYGASAAENAAMERIQLHMLAALLRDFDLGGRRVVELGCGIGRLAPWFRQHGARYVGVDISSEMLQLAKEQLGGRVSRVDSSSLPFRDGSFDLACSITVLHHNPYERQALMLDELVRVVRPGGRLLLMESIRPGPRTRAAFHVFPRPVDDWVETVRGAGRCELVRLIPCRWSVLRDGAEVVARRLRRGQPGGAEPEGRARHSTLPGWLDRALTRTGGRIDPYLMRWLPPPLARTACMCFRRR
jgi:SAM-dependent methyltransferase